MHRLGALLVVSICTACAQAQKASVPSSYEPIPGMQGKDAVWIATPQVVVDKMLEMAKVGPRDFVMDLGSGDGRTVIAAAKRGARALGVEYNPDLVEYSRRNAEKAGVAAGVSFVKADLFETDLTQATVITLFLGQELNLKLRPRLLELKPGTRIASNTFTMGDWKEDERADVKDCTESCTALFWIVPARVAGSYWTPLGQFTFEQRFQFITGALRAGGNTFALEGQVRGEEIVFTVAYPVGSRRLSGRLNGGTLELR
jgi:SAM-dependent methyltransferase